MRVPGVADGVGIALEQAELQRAAATARDVAARADRMLATLDVPPPQVAATGTPAALLAAELTKAEAVLRAVATRLKRGHEDLADRLDAVVSGTDALADDTTAAARRPG